LYEIDVLFVAVKVPKSNSFETDLLLAAAINDDAVALQ